MVQAMAPVGSAGFRSWEGEGEGGADLRRIRRDWPMVSRLLDPLSLSLYPSLLINSSLRRDGVIHGAGL